MMIISRLDEEFLAKHPSEVTQKAVDLRILSLCQHSIITYGTFGIWSALLRADGGEVVMADGYAEDMPGEVEDMRRAKLEGWRFMDTKTLAFVET